MKYEGRKCRQRRGEKKEEGGGEKKREKGKWEIKNKNRKSG